MNHIRVSAKHSQLLILLSWQQENISAVPNLFAFNNSAHRLQWQSTYPWKMMSLWSLILWHRKTLPWLEQFGTMLYWCCFAPFKEDMWQLLGEGWGIRHKQLRYTKTTKAQLFPEGTDPLPQKACTIKNFPYMVALTRCQNGQTHTQCWNVSTCISISNVNNWSLSHSETWSDYGQNKSGTCGNHVKRTLFSQKVDWHSLFYYHASALLP